MSNQNLTGSVDVIMAVRTHYVIYVDFLHAQDMTDENLQVPADASEQIAEMFEGYVDALRNQPELVSTVMDALASDAEFQKARTNFEAFAAALNMLDIEDPLAQNKERLFTSIEKINFLYETLEELNAQ